MRVRRAEALARKVERGFDLLIDVLGADGLRTAIAHPENLPDLNLGVPYL